MDSTMAAIDLPGADGEEDDIAGEDTSISPDDLPAAQDEFDPFFWMSEEDVMELLTPSTSAGAKPPPGKADWSRLQGDDKPKISVDGGRASVLAATQQEINCLYESYSQDFPDHKLDFEFFCERTFGPDSKLAAHFKTAYGVQYRKYAQFLATLFVTCRFNDILGNLLNTPHFNSNGLMELQEYADMWKIFQPKAQDNRSSVHSWKELEDVVNSVYREAVLQRLAKYLGTQSLQTLFVAIDDD